MSRNNAPRHPEIGDCCVQGRLWFESLPPVRPGEKEQKSKEHQHQGQGRHKFPCTSFAQDHDGRLDALGAGGVVGNFDAGRG